MKLIVLMMCMALLAGCGGGGDSASTATTPDAVVAKTSVVDGAWLYGTVQADGIIKWMGQLDFYNGTIRKDYSVVSINITETGTFDISGNTITLHYTKSSASPSGLSLSDLGTVRSTDTVMDVTRIYTFTVVPKKLTFTDGAGVITEYVKP